MTRKILLASFDTWLPQKLEETADIASSNDRVIQAIKVSTSETFWQLNPPKCHFGVNYKAIRDDFG